jgi:hypothetical protein
MYSRTPNGRRLGSLAAALMIVACRQPIDRSADRPVSSPPSLLSDDSGAAMLANVDNARSAIADKSAMAAANDLIQASSLAPRLPDVGAPAQPGLAARSEPQSPSTPPMGLSAFQAEVLLTTAQSNLELGDPAAADARLADIQQRAPSPRVPADLPLLRADQSLYLARIAVEGEHPGELKTQLSIAETSLAAYRGASEAANAKALAGAIERTLNQPGCLERLQPDRLKVWSGQVDAWR